MHAQVVANFPTTTTALYVVFYSKFHRITRQNTVIDVNAVLKTARGLDRLIGTRRFRRRIKTKKPSLYRVVILNDDYTPMEFVVFVLERLFNMGAEDAYRVMLHVHNHGVGICGVFTYEVAETKVAQVRDLAQRNEHPLRCDLERED